MSHTLNLVDGLLAAARTLQTAGRAQAAIDLLLRLAGFRQLAPVVAEEIHSRLADLYAGLEQYKAARRHLAIALTFRPQHAAYHHRMGQWIEADSEVAVERARAYYRQAVRSEPDNAEYCADYGAYLLNNGWQHPGRSALLRALRLGVHDPEIVGRIAGALREAGQWNDARKVLRRARFQNRNDRRFAALWQQHQFDQICAQQQVRDQALARHPGMPALLPFRRTETPRASVQVEGKVLRIDRAEPAGATLPLPKRELGNPRNRRSS